MKECNNCGHLGMSHGKKVVGTTERRVCNVAGCECVS